MRKMMMSAALALGLAGCSVATPFRFSAPDASASGDTVIVAITEARLGDDAAQRRAFWTHVERVEATLEGRPGFLGFSKRTEVFGDLSWTMTAWADEASLDAFVRSETHQTAIAEAYGGLEGARFVRFTMSRAALPPPWSEALERLDRSGRSY